MSSTTTTLLNLVTIIVICLGILMSHNNQSGVEAGRVLLRGSSNSEDFASANHLQSYTFSSSSSAYEHAKNTMAFWLQRLASGPSPKGPGH
ncbi:hypothetical protein HN51_010220 [Arachis hypogaea]|uniref:Uncharacterized protein n=1 Tax=Arachis hypogaea TaxID=3818 RepID=A0A445E3U4_ARAHY|nr:hypothetical protein Ahy_A03g016613 [Arachis hypogaea]